MTTLFFDGVCGLCDRTVTFLFLRDAKHALRFAPLQGKTAEAKLPKERLEKLDTIVLLAEDGTMYVKSEAVLRALVRIGGLWKLMGACLVLPRFIRDFAYEAVAANRYKLFGKHDACRLPTPAERPYFLD